MSLIIRSYVGVQPQPADWAPKQLLNGACLQVLHWVYAKILQFIQESIEKKMRCVGEVKAPWQKQFMGILPIKP